MEYTTSGAEVSDSTKVALRLMNFVRMVMNMERKSTFLKVVSIIMVIIGGLGVLAGISNLIVGGSGAIADLSNQLAELGFDIDLGLADSMAMASIVEFIAAIVMTVAGIVGLQSFNKPEKASSCMICAIVFLAAQLCSSIVTIATTTGFVMMGAIIGLPFILILPILFFVGVSKLKKLGEAPGQQPPSPNYYQ